MINKKRQEDLRKEIDRNINNGQVAGFTAFERKEIDELKTKLSENILAHNNCLDDFSEKVKKAIKMKDTKILAEVNLRKKIDAREHRQESQDEIDKIKNEMKIKEAKG